MKDSVRKVKRQATSGGKHLQIINVTKDSHLEHIKHLQNSIVREKRVLYPSRKQEKDMNSHFTKEEVWMANKHTKRCSTS